MSQVHVCKDNSELSPLYPSRGLHLKPIARLNVSVHYPELKQTLTTGGKSISSWDIMERIKGLVSPEIFIFLRVVKNTLEFIRFEGDLESRDVLKKIISRLDGKTMKVTGFKEPLKIRCAESKLAFPSKYDWDSYFRDAKNMNEMKAGERPDTIHFQNLPCKWFSEDGGRTAASTSTSATTSEKDKDAKILPSEKLFKRIWGGFGEVRCIDIPSCDPYRNQISTGVRGISTFTFGTDNVFEAYVQYKDYMSFVKAMDALRGCSLFYQETPVGKFYVANIKVEFDKSKHLSDESIKKRKIERDRLAEKDKVKKTAEKLSKFEAEVKEQKQQEKEKKETEKNLAKIEYKIAMEERKYLIARRKLEAIRLMDYLFETVKQNIVNTAEKKRLLKENTKKEMKRLQKLVIERNAKEKEAIEMEQEDKPSKVRKLQSAVKVVSGVDNKDRTRDKPSDSEDPRKSADLKPSDESSRKPAPSHPHYYDTTRYVGDWEVKAKSYGGSEVKVSSNYVPVSSSTYRGRGPGHRGGYYRGRGGGPPPGPYPHTRGPAMPPDNYYRDRRQEFGPPPYPYPHPGGPHPHPPPHYDYRTGDRPYDRPHEEPPRNNVPPTPSRNRGEDENFENGSGQSVRHDFSYLDELDRAYEKYFSSITKRNNDE